MDVDLIFRIAAIGIIVAVLNQLLVRSGREEQAMMTTLAGLIVVLMMIIQQIDVLFQSAADGYGERLLGVLLSGANEDGAAGLAAIHAAGGHAVVQAPDTAAMRAMPDAALARIDAAEVLAPAAIAALLSRLPAQTHP